MKKILILILLSAAAVTLYGTDRISLEIQHVSPGTRDVKQELESVLERAAAGASRRYSRYIEVYAPGELRGRADYKMTVTAVLEGESPVIALQFSRSGAREGLNQSLLGGIGENTHLYLSEVIFKLWTQLNPEAIAMDQAVPQFMEEVPSEYIIEAAVPDFSGYNTASAVAVKEGGKLVLGMGALCFEANSDFDILSPIGEDQFTATGATFIFGASVTPGGTIYLKPANGREIYRVVEGAPRTMKVRAGIDVNGPMAVLPNGVVILYHIMNRKFVRIEGNRRSEIDLDLGPYTYIYGMAAGPEGNLWIYDNVENRFKIYSDDGTFISSLIPVGIEGETLNPMSMVITSDSSILMYSNSALYKFNREGILLWKMTGYRFREEETFPMTPVNLAVDEERGFIYMADYASNRILKLYDSQMNRGIDKTEIEELLSLNEALNRDPYSTEAVRDKADYYLKKESWVLARLWLEELVNENPFDEQAIEALEQIEIASLLNQAAELGAKTLETASNIGPESARNLYSRTVSLYERILSISPGNSEITTRLNRFREAYNREAAGTGGSEKPLTIASVSLQGIFPSLIHYYRNNPVGTVRVKNDLDAPVSNVRATLDLGRFTDFPIESEALDKLAPGEEAVLKLQVLLNDQAFNLSEDIPLPVKVSVNYDKGGNSLSTSATKAATMYRRTALTWDDTAKLAAFIMPNESIVSAFSHRVLGQWEKSPGLPAQMSKAARISDAVGTYDITYIEDPNSPISQIMGREQHVDTVRYPRTTLHIRSGDCDDSTALLASLLESSGISTAIMTSPGHVFMAFDTEEPAGNRWMFESEKRSVQIHGGTIWIPLETTVLQEGFNGAWETASAIIKRHNSNDIEFLAVAEQREDFPPLPLGESHLIVVEPGHSQIDSLNSDTVTALTEAIHHSNVRELEQAIRESSGRRKRQNSNRLAILHARFGEYRKAERLFKDLIDEDSAYLSPYMNLGNIYYLQGRYDEALEILTAAQDLRSDSVMLNLALAKTYYRLGDRANTERYYGIVKMQSDTLSEQYAYLSDNKGITRAGIDDEPPLGWAGE